MFVLSESLIELTIIILDFLKVIYIFQFSKLFAQQKVINFSITSLPASLEFNVYLLVIIKFIN